MQTFLPFPNFVQSAECLDLRRLGKQRVEVIQILNALLIPGKGWKQHPAVKMWAGHEWALAEYGLSICQEWFYTRLCRDTCESQIRRIQNSLPEGVDTSFPAWIGNEQFHRSHRANLLRKDWDYYAPKFDDADQLDVNMPYYWPTDHEGK